MQKLSVKPMTLNIIPPSSTPQHNENNTYQIPTVNYLPTNSFSQSGFTDDDKLASRSEKNREHQRRHVMKVKPYQQLINIDNPEERVVTLLLLSYPELEKLPRYVLQREVYNMMCILRSAN